MPLVKLKTTDDDVIDVDYEVIKCAHLVSDVLEDVGMQGLLTRVWPLVNVDSDTLRRVIAWATHHKDNPLPDDVDTIPPWDSEFLNVENKILFRILIAALFLGIQSLMNIARKKVISRMQNMPNNQILTLFYTDQQLVEEFSSRL
ncbi:S-phase kinase-associated protein 1-like [Coccinella septempunctata]|uniref:S-phase kinase-associated protein 1-like n=1 Tax=Coccinella septempunctata TaxID=41139 RepID=UPI001D06E398|nr:S-phase kinase-associated protein 1-like [Coccinella septempunctata]